MDLLGLLMLFGLGAVIVAGLAVIGYVYGLGRPPRLTYAAALGRGWVVEPSELGLEAQSLTLTANGETLAGWRIAGRAPEKPVFVVLHGYGGSRYSELSLASILVDYARAVVLFDMPGHGESTGLSRAGVGEASAVMAVMEQATGADEPLVMLGRSMGAGLALHVAAGMTDSTSRPLQAVILEGVYRHWSEPARRRLWLKRWPPEPMVSAAMAWMVIRGVKPAAFNALKPASQLTRPLLLLHGDADRVCPPPLAQAVAEQTKAARLVRFPGGGHLNLHLHDESRYREAISTFLEESRGGKPRDGYPSALG